MDALSVTVADEVNSVAERNRNRQLRRTEVSSSTSTAVKQRRRLTVGPQLPTQLAPLVDIGKCFTVLKDSRYICTKVPLDLEYSFLMVIVL